ncbi:type IV secretory pathway TrbL component [Bradyrhizobium japonicum]|uniref:hypothetical protein n=1 Tax=Bradyrhizobium TaxID=374 RepID=UPI0004879D21|nr:MULTISPECIES: hypothetical protein [Bradyrhizobium]MBR0884182.1 hypothetical protein [Bradyrhizobium liaoningense]MBR0947180.1 hypothetical protein [Bradyrhizobium liaoningense]MBR1002452.1 hypothetical protein [Bradyrhizobium liaoningense]MBR1033562.1 hypothetical protein [Bradyrhizobium liaoningense]MBR1069511.1 hypothetical protein [Bradyrhizobium liaoningense]
MLTKSMLLGAVLVVSSTIAFGGPCNTANRDAGSGPVTTGQAATTTGTASPSAKEHSPTSAMNKASENTATSSQDAQRQMQSQPTAAEQSKATTGTRDNDC